MKLKVFLTVATVAATSLFGPAAIADTYSTVTTTDQAQPMSESRETRTTTVESAPSTDTVVREQPIIINQPAEKEVVVVKKHQHHLIKVGPIKVF